MSLLSNTQPDDERKECPAYIGPLGTWDAGDNGVMGERTNCSCVCLGTPVIDYSQGSISTLASPGWCVGEHPGKEGSMGSSSGTFMSSPKSEGTSRKGRRGGGKLYMQRGRTGKAISYMCTVHSILKHNY